ncbi:MAG: hypothetical protein AAB262_09450, partial [Elusimicrobiota bacterium]
MRVLLACGAAAAILVWLLYPRSAIRPPSEERPAAERSLATGTAVARAAPVLPAAQSPAPAPQPPSPRVEPMIVRPPIPKSATLPSTRIISNKGSVVMPPSESPEGEFAPAAP